MPSRLLSRFVGLLRGKPAGSPAGDTPTPYAAVTVTTTTVCCEAARATHEQPLLLSSCPRLPLPGCSMPEDCICRFRHWPDRRIGERRLPLAKPGATSQAPEAKPRTGHDRRKR